MSDCHIWLRAETKPREQRRALSPEDARRIIDHGFDLTVERSSQAIFEDAEFTNLGCCCVAEGSWQSDAPLDAYVLGLKSLPRSNTPLAHRHIYFAHAFKGQRGWEDLLDRFGRGGGSLLDLEYLADEGGRRVAAFGYWAGFAGAATAVSAWCGAVG